MEIAGIIRSISGRKMTIPAIIIGEVIGCSGTHTMEKDGVTVYMPCSTHAEYDELIGADDTEEKQTNFPKRGDAR